MARLVLAFDGSCSRCRAISARVRLAAGRQLEVLPLDRPDVVQWRVSALGAEPPFEPTLLAISGEGTATGWTGRRMLWPLTRALGLRKSLAVVRSLGGRGDPIELNEANGEGVLTRKRFLQFGVGLGAVAGLALTGKMPAAAADDPVAAWIAANRDNLPTSYDAIVQYPMEYRRAIFRELRSSTKAALWNTQFDKFESTHPDLTDGQKQVIANARSTIVDPGTYSGTPPASLEQLQAAAETEFGGPTARTLFAALGPSDMTEFNPTYASAANAIRDCTCSVQSDWCDNQTYCTGTTCAIKTGCGTAWAYVCDARCYG